MEDEKATAAIKLTNLILSQYTEEELYQYAMDKMVDEYYEQPLEAILDVIAQIEGNVD